LLVLESFRFGRKRPCRCDDNPGR